MESLRRYVITGGDPETRHDIIARLRTEGYMTTENVTTYVREHAHKHDPPPPEESIAKAILDTQVEWETEVPSCVDRLVMDESYVDKVAELSGHLDGITKICAYNPSYDCVFFLKGADSQKSYTAKAMYQALGIPLVEIEDKSEILAYDYRSYELSDIMAERVNA